MIYLDNAATTFMSHDVITEMTHAMQQIGGNPSSTYQLGRRAKKALENARVVMGQSINAQPKDIIFTSGGTESNNTALYALAKQSDKKHIMTTTIEHPSVYEVMKQFEKDGYTITYLPVNEQGQIAVEQVEQALRADTAFVSIMAVNNETGAIQPIRDIALLLQKHNIPFHSDCVQAYGVLPIDVQKTPVTMVSVSSHKIHGPKGVGFLYVNGGQLAYPLLRGGGQEHNRRSGTENIHSIIGFAKAVEQLNIMDNINHFTTLQDTLINGLEMADVPFAINGYLHHDHKTPKIVNLYFKGIPSSKLLIQLDLEGIMVSAGSACSAGSLLPSRVLLEQFPENKERASQSIRISFSKMTTVEEIELLVEKLQKFTV